MLQPRLLVPKLTDDNVQRLYTQAKRFDWLSVAELLNFIVSTGLERLEEVNNPIAWETYELVRPEEEPPPSDREALGHGPTTEELREQRRQSMTYVQCHFPCEEEP